jgi:hypothetical protein
MQDAFTYCAELVRAADRDRFIASLFAPAERRGALHALHAFNAELARVRDVAHAALPGEIRLQWWSDVINRERDEEARANPVAAALLDTIERYGFAPEKFIDLIEARRFDLYDDPMAGLADLEAYAAKTASVLFAFAAQILAGVGAEAVSTPAGIAYAIAGLLRAFSASRRAGVSFMFRQSYSSAIRCVCTTYLPGELRPVSMPRSRKCATSRVAISTQRMSTSRRCRLRPRRLFFPRPWCVLRSIASSAAHHSRPPKSRPGGGNGSFGARRETRRELQDEKIRTRNGRADCAGRKRSGRPAIAQPRS